MILVLGATGTTGGEVARQLIAALLDLLAAMKAGHTDAVTDGVKQVLGRNPVTFESWAQRHKSAFL